MHQQSSYWTRLCEIVRFQHRKGCVNKWWVVGMVLSCNQINNEWSTWGPDSIQRCHLTGIGILIFAYKILFKLWSVSHNYGIFCKLLALSQPSISWHFSILEQKGRWLVYWDPFILGLGNFPRMPFTLSMYDKSFYVQFDAIFILVQDQWWLRYHNFPNDNSRGTFSVDNVLSIDHDIWYICKQF